MKIKNHEWIVLLALLILLGASLNIFADPTKAQAPLPDGPLLSSGGDFTAWQITYAYDSDKPSPNGQPPPPPPKTPFGQLSLLPVRSVTLTRTKPYWHSVTTDIGGGKMEQWSDGASRLFSEGDFPPMLAPSAPSWKFPDFNTIGFPDMDWISASTYVGSETIDGKKCLAFSKGDMKTWVELNSRFPVRWQRGKEVRTFRQLPPPTDSLSPPPDISAVFVSLKRNLRH